MALPLLMAGTGALQLVAKWAIDRPWPNLAEWGFPSGHVLSLVVFFGLVAYLLAASSLRRSRRSLGYAGCAATVLVVAFSRMYLEAHWVSDLPADSLWASPIAADDLPHRDGRAPLRDARAGRGSSIELRSAGPACRR